MTSKYIDLATKRASVAALIRQGRAMVASDNVSMESAEAYMTMGSILTDEPLGVVTDATQTPAEIVEQAHDRLVAVHSDLDGMIESETDVDALLGDTVSLDHGDVAEQVVALSTAMESLTALRNTARVIYHTPSLRRSAKTRIALQRHAARTLSKMDIPRAAYKGLLSKNASLESVHSTLSTLARATDNLMTKISANVTSVSVESLVALADPAKALVVQKAKQLLDAHAEKRGAV